MSQQHHLNKKSIISKTVQVSLLTMLSRILGITREMLLVRYLGIGGMSDAFIIAFKIPNFFRHIFAEGALSASFVPAIVSAVKNKDTESARGLMTLSFIFFEGIVLFMYMIVFFFADWIVFFSAPGFDPERVAYTIPLLRIMFPFLIFVSSSALLAGGLQAVNHFVVPASGSALWNAVLIATLYAALLYKLPASFVAYGVVLGGVVMFIAHLLWFFKLKLSFGAITDGSKRLFEKALWTFFPSVCGVSIVEVNLFVGEMIASYLPTGSISLLHYSSRFRHIPVGVFGVALATTLLPHFSRLVLYAPSRLNFYLLEVIKFVTWLIVPVSLFLIFVAPNFFSKVLIAKNATPEQVAQATTLFIILLSGLLFVCVNKALLSMLYALKDTRSAMIASGMSAVVNVVGDLIGIQLAGVYGIAVASVLASASLTVTLMYILYEKHQIRLSLDRYKSFLRVYGIELAIAIGSFYGAYWVIGWLVAGSWLEDFVMIGIGYWIVVFGLGGAAMLGLWKMGRGKVYFVGG